MNANELAELQRLAPKPGRLPSQIITRETIVLQVLGYIERLPDRTLRLTNKGIAEVVNHRIDVLRSH